MTSLVGILHNPSDPDCRCDMCIGAVDDLGADPPQAFCERCKFAVPDYDAAHVAFPGQPTRLFHEKCYRELHEKRDEQPTAGDDVASLKAEIASDEEHAKAAAAEIQRLRAQVVTKQDFEQLTAALSASFTSLADGVMACNQRVFALEESQNELKGLLAEALTRPGALVSREVADKLSSLERAVTDSPVNKLIKLLDNLRRLADTIAPTPGKD